MRVRLIGLPTDSHSSFLRGAASGPAAIRAALASDHANTAAESGLELGTDLIVEDVGDLPLNEDGGDPALIADAIFAAAADGALPLCLGGDHMVTGPIVAALAAVHGPLNILHFDAHPDLYDDYEGDPLSHASPFARIMEAGLAARLIQIGIRADGPHLRDQARRFGVESFTAEEVGKAIAVLPSGPVYLSIDLDGLDPAFAPGVKHYEPGGLSTREVLAIIAAIPGPLVGADIVELCPDRDHRDMTAKLAAKLVKEIAGMMVKTAR
jgi:agmatinase